MRVEGPLAAKELVEAETRWIRLEQEAAYPLEVGALISGKAIASRSSLLALNPFVDEAKLLCVGGRLRHASTRDDIRHPTILPPASRLTSLIIEAVHRPALHGGAQLTLAMLRQRHWVPKGRLLVRRVIHRCVTDVSPA